MSFQCPLSGLAMGGAIPGLSWPLVPELERISGPGLLAGQLAPFSRELSVPPGWRSDPGPPVRLPWRGAGLPCPGLLERAAGTSSLWPVCCLAAWLPGSWVAGDERLSPSLGSWAPPTGPPWPPPSGRLLRALNSVTRYRATVLQAFKDMNRLTVKHAVLSTRDVLVLLHKWSLLERDVRLQEDLRLPRRSAKSGSC